MTSHINQYSMNLKKLLSGYFHDEKMEAKLKEIIIRGLSLDSRKIKESYLFLAIKGETVNGMEFINNAIEQGAAAVLWDVDGDADTKIDAIKINWRKTSAGKNVPIIAVENLIQRSGLLADRFYGMPSKDLPVCGITGTNGKTSCADFIAQMMSVNASCGMMGTLGSGLYPELKETGYTTPDAITCHQWLADIKSNNAKFAVMEVSSHALIQGRVNGIHFDSAIFTNLSRDHLDFHGDMESYAEAKLRLFKSPGLKKCHYQC